MLAFPPGPRQPPSNCVVKVLSRKRYTSDSPVSGPQDSTKSRPKAARLGPNIPHEWGCVACLHLHSMTYTCSATCAWKRGDSANAPLVQGPIACTAALSGRPPLFSRSRTAAAAANRQTGRQYRGHSRRRGEAARPTTSSWQDFRRRRWGRDPFHSHIAPHVELERCASRQDGHSSGNQFTRADCQRTSG